MTGIDAGYREAVRQVTTWRAINIRVPRVSQSSITFTVDEGYGGQPQMRGTLSIARSTGAVEKWESFRDQSRGRRLRTWLRFAHTGEYYGLVGQTAAALASAGGVVLVWTGAALCYRRLKVWLARRREVETQPRRAA